MRTITSEPRNGEKIPVKTLTNIHAILEFQQGATITLSTSWDVWVHRHKKYGTLWHRRLTLCTGPNFFWRELELIGPDGTARDLDEFAELRFLNLIGYVLYFIRKLLRNSAILAAAIIGSIIIFVVFAFIVAPEDDLLRA